MLSSIEPYMLVVSAPIMPAQSLILTHVNSTYIILNLATWLSGGCPIQFYSIQFQYWGSEEWLNIEAHISPNKVDI